MRAVASAPPPNSFHALLSEIQKENRSPADAQLALLEKIGRLNPEELEALLSAEIERNPSFMRSSPAGFRFAARRLSEIAPLKAAQLWVSNGSLRSESDSLLEPWAKKNPGDFVAWMKTLSPELQRATASTLGSIASRSPAEFAAIAGSLSDTPPAGPATRAAMEALLQKAGESKDPSSALQFANALPEGPMRNIALAQIAKWPGLKLSEQPEVLAAIAQLPREDAARLGRDVPAQAEALPAGVARDMAFLNKLRTQAEKDPTAAASRLESMAGSADYPAAVRGFVEATAMRDPATAAAWALSIDPAAGPQQRLSALERAASSMFRRNPDEAREWVEKAPLSNTEYFLLTGRKRGS
ncbi:MAG: hypothetical protein RLZZ142_2538 [Verrucomicrobiota bacterium]|jgi:hypothetical protein